MLSAENPCNAQLLPKVLSADRPCATQLMQLLFDGDIELGIVCTVLSSVVAVGGIPLSVDLFIRHLEDASFELPWGELFWTLGAVTLGALSGTITRYRSDELGKRLESFTATLGVLILLGTVAFALVSNAAIVAEIEAETWGAGALMGPAGILLGYAPARLARLDERRAKTVAIEAGEVNIGVACAPAAVRENRSCHRAPWRPQPTELRTREKRTSQQHSASAAQAPIASL